MQTGIGTSTTWPVGVNLPDSASLRNSTIVSELSFPTKTTSPDGWIPKPLGVLPPVDSCPTKLNTAG